MKSVVQVQTDDRTLNQAQQNIKNALGEIQKSPLNGGVLLQGIALTSGDNTVTTKLGRTLTGWILTRVRGSAVIYDKQDSNSQKGNTLILNSSANVTIDLYVF
jgi:hypothetical protein